MVATYTLHLTYSDLTCPRGESVTTRHTGGSVPCYQDRLRLTVYSAGEICAEICKIGAYEAHWALRHPITIDGPFPFVVGEFPNRAFVAGLIRGLAIGQRRYVYQSRVGDASYTAIVQRFS